MTKHGFHTMSLSQNDSPWKGNTNSHVKKKFWVQQLMKKVMLTGFWKMKGSINIDFLEEGASVNSGSSC